MTMSNPVTKAVIAALALVALAAQQDLPQRPPGRFQATTKGLLKGTVAGDVSASAFRDGHREIYLQMDSSQMMATGILVSLQVTLPAGKAGPSFRLQVEDIRTHKLSTPPATGTLDLKGTSMFSGSFSVTSTDTATPLTLSGSFDKAPLVQAIE